MMRSLTAFAFLVAAALPASAGDYWDDGEFVDGYVVRESYAYRSHDLPAYRPHVYVPYGSVYADYYPEQRYARDRYVPDQECTIKRKWRHGVMTEKIKCERD